MLFNKIYYQLLMKFLYKIGKKKCHIMKTIHR